jgi:hypothetical protein
MLRAIDPCCDVELSMRTLNALGYSEPSETICFRCAAPIDRGG